MRALVLEVRLQVELRGPRDFIEVAMFAECVDAVIMRVSGQDMHKPWKKQAKRGSQ